MMRPPAAANALLVAVLAAPLVVAACSRAEKSATTPAANAGGKKQDTHRPPELLASASAAPPVEAEPTTTSARARGKVELGEPEILDPKHKSARSTQDPGALSANRPKGPKVAKADLGDVANVQRAVQARFADFLACYESALDRNPKAAGVVRTRFTVEKSGHAASAVEDAGSTIADPDLLRCVQSKFRQLEVTPAPGSAVTVVYPLVLSPAS